MAQGALTVRSFKTLQPSAQCQGAIGLFQQGRRGASHRHQAMRRDGVHILRHAAGWLACAETCSPARSLSSATAGASSGRDDSSQTGAAYPSSAAFVFDIDGVLIKGRHVLPAAVRALSKIYRGGKPTVPTAFLTNGGGCTEARKAADLSEWLGVPVTENQVVLAHTPFRSLVPLYAALPVLVVGRGDTLQVAKAYGFQKVTMPRQVARSMPAAVPFWPDRHKWAAGGGQQYSPPLRYGTPAAPIRAVMVFADPVDWYLDLQIIMDVIAGGGVVGRRPEDVPPGTPPVDLIFSNPDFLFANEFPAPRFGQGALRACLEALHQQLTGKPLDVKHTFGKPNAQPYQLIENLLEEQARSLGLSLPPMQHDAGGRLCSSFSNIFAIGDNPAADVRGANAAGDPWTSVLVRTGVFAGRMDNCPIDPAHIVVDDVEAAVDAGFHRMRNTIWHSMR